MRKVLLSIFMTAILACSVDVQAQDFAAYPKAAAHHLFSADGIADIVAAYGVAMLVTIVHEMGHAAVAKLLCDAPVDIAIGGPRREDSCLKVGGIEFAGFNPLESDARWEEYRKGDDQIYRPTPSQEIAVLIAGPAAQAATGFCLYALLANVDKFYIAKAAAIGAIIDTVIGMNGIYGARYLEWTDAAKIVKSIKQFNKSN